MGAPSIFLRKCTELGEIMCPRLCELAPKLEGVRKRDSRNLGPALSSSSVHPYSLRRSSGHGHASTWSYKKTVEICHWLRNDDDIVHEKVERRPIMVSGASPYPNGVDERYDWHVFSTLFLFPPSNHALFWPISILIDVLFLIFGNGSLHVILWFYFLLDLLVIL